MKKRRFTNIGHLYGSGNTKLRVGSELAKVTELNNAFFEVENGKCTGFGWMQDLDNPNIFDGEVIDMQGKTVMPTYVDCHTHLVFAETREQEFEDRLNGMSYQEIAERGGGILNSASKLSNKSEDDLYRESMVRLDHLIRLGTGAIEIKSGYGLSTEAELKMLRVIKRIKEASPIPVKSTYLGAHAFPARFANNHEAYIQEILSETLPIVAKEGLADYLDVFCEKGYFDLSDTERILKKGEEYGLRARIHVNQFNAIGGVELANKYNAISVEHLEVMGDNDLEVMRNGKMFAVGLPACSFFLNIPYTPARMLIEANVPFALASDFNPGSSPTGNLNFVFALACLYMKITPTEAFNSLTIQAAHALEMSNEVGSIDVGKRANFMVFSTGTKLATIPYHFGDLKIEQVWINGNPYS